MNWLYGIGAITLPVDHYNEVVDKTSHWEYDGVVLMLESIIAHQYSEEPRDESIPFTDD